ncbi:SDR family oxidoreductase [Pseudogulbenkiania subflava]|uniref:Nucleoside-diphosphate-sugar epimerase n=1 Tax=Pseudogulbenkiania subflava DSM 22618 TaxID=1123014 RepID=A0A1Y6BZH9_9NEIS|nr:SDR family oxidoreductase [Pseudogulbenkiania subflava]SMF37636.1 Nucleoside-diphosphate-sugar epimerase [Pseudogulbenkiania subflava DSM 22618]
MRTLLIAGFGDVARRAVPLLAPHWRLLALVRRPEQADEARRLGIQPVLADLDDKRSLARLAGLADALLYTAPPPERGEHDPRLGKLLCTLAKGKSLPQRVVYISTSGVYGDAGGAWLDETAPLRPQSARAKRRVDAERRLRAFARSSGASITILRAPGIYAAERLPTTRLINGTPLIAADEDSYGNHIHADDLARLCAAALRRTGGIRIYNACDDEPLTVGEWYDRLADALGMPRAPRLPRIEVQAAVSPALWSFLAESRRLDNHRLKRELKVRLRYPTVASFLATLPGPTT